ncbi:MAG: ribonuclease P protein component [Parcubacteria group bacterium]|jgi:ribonuclease P protein component
MLARQFRITKKENFEIVYRQGRNFSSGAISLMVRENGFGLTRFGVVASTKFSKHAVERNRIKRQIREIVRKNKKKVRLGLDIVISARKVGSKTKHSSFELEVAILESLRRAKLINEKKN